MNQTGTLQPEQTHSRVTITLSAPGESKVNSSRTFAVEHFDGSKWESALPLDLAMEGHRRGATETAYLLQERLGPEAPVRIIERITYVVETPVATMVPAATIEDSDEIITDPHIADEVPSFGTGVLDEHEPKVEA